jgi:hypothetical protein
MVSYPNAILPFFEGREPNLSLPLTAEMEIEVDREETCSTVNIVLAIGIDDLVVACWARERYEAEVDGREGREESVLVDKVERDKDSTTSTTAHVPFRPCPCP